MKVFVRSVYPALLLLRLADRKKPAMDQLYFYVRRMNDTINRSKSLLDKMEEKYNECNGQDIATIMIQYYLDVSGSAAEYTNELKFGGYADANDSGDSDSESNVVPDDDSSEISGNILLDVENTLGDKVVKLWKKRQVKLTHDLAITAWVVSPNPEIMKDADTNRTGTEQLAVERLIKLWFGHEVSDLRVRYVIFYRICYDLRFFRSITTKIN